MSWVLFGLEPPHVGSYGDEINRVEPTRTIKTIGGVVGVLDRDGACFDAVSLPRGCDSRSDHVCRRILGFLQAGMGRLGAKLQFQRLLRLLCDRRRVLHLDGSNDISMEASNPWLTSN